MSDSPQSSDAHRDEPPRKRVKLACQACQVRRLPEASRIAVSQAENELQFTVSEKEDKV